MNTEIKAISLSAHDKAKILKLALVIYEGKRGWLERLFGQIPTVHYGLCRCIRLAAVCHFCNIPTGLSIDIDYTRECTIGKSVLDIFVSEAMFIHTIAFLGGNFGEDYWWPPCVNKGRNTNPRIVFLKMMIDYYKSIS